MQKLSLFLLFLFIFSDIISLVFYQKEWVKNQKNIYIFYTNISISIFINEIFKWNFFKFLVWIFRSNSDTRSSFYRKILPRQKKFRKRNKDITINSTRYLFRIWRNLRNIWNYFKRIWVFYRNFIWGKKSKFKLYKNVTYWNWF